MIPWLTRPPTPEEVEAHSKAHRATGPDDDAPWGYWLRDDGAARLVLLSADEHGVWLSDGDLLTERRCSGARWLPCTAEGLAVCLLPKEGA